MTDLYPCPLCGSSDVHAEKNEWAHLYAWGFRCNGCDTEFKLNTVTRDKAMEKWNNRAPVPEKMCANCKHHRITGEFGVFLCSYMCDKTGEDDWSNTYCGVCDNWESE